MTHLERRLRGSSGTDYRCVQSTLQRHGVSIPVKYLNLLEYSIPAAPWCITIYRLIRHV
jgi:hypothetical protein